MGCDLALEWREKTLLFLVSDPPDMMSRYLTQTLPVLLCLLGYSYTNDGRSLASFPVVCALLASMYTDLGVVQVYRNPHWSAMKVFISSTII